MDNVECHDEILGEDASNQGLSYGSFEGLGEGNGVLMYFSVFILMNCWLVIVRNGWEGRKDKRREREEKWEGTKEGEVVGGREK